MNNEQKILEYLGQMVEHQHKTEVLLTEMKQEQALMKQEMTVMKQEQALMKQEMTVMKQEQALMKQEQALMKQEMNERFDTLETSIKFAWQDIAHVERRIKQHEKEFHSVG